MFTAKLKDIEYYLPETVLSNQDLLKENPSWDIDSIVAKSGVLSRHIADSGQTALDLAYEACKKLFAKKGISKDEIGAIVFCTQSPDHILPPNSYILHQKLNLGDDTFAFDINLACSGYIYGLDIVRSLFLTHQMNNILFITADTYSRYIHPKDKSVRMLFGDGAAVTLLEKAQKGIIDIKLGAFGKGYNKFIIPAGACRIPKSQETGKEARDRSNNVRSQENIFMEGFSLLSLVMAKVPDNIREILKTNNLTARDIKLFIFHQASKAVSDSLRKALDISEDKVFNNITNIGNTVSASIPIAIKDALNQQRIEPGDKILISGFGVGFSWGSAILEWS
jgi:3-oxoacyl-[acyl-carrier-protein] synthase-3